MLKNRETVSTVSRVSVIRASERKNFIPDFYKSRYQQTKFGVFQS